MPKLPRANRSAWDAPYRATRYRVYLPTTTEDIRIGHPAPAVDAWMDEHASGTATVITACNPHSRQHSRAANRRAQCALLHLLHAMPHPMLPGRNLADAGDWPPEHSLIVAGLSRGEARRLAARFRQNAVVWLSRGSRARLLWVRR
ncbi:DUF3293 domain-containing protein [Algiphilus sp.]|uniref:DUF3293 domain-containing protein n=1 Tax=Algiphilus sp. TaxID=1872431 RepID=UPI0025B8106F|nr:DUF3293 domain-containing protein [Algiphilus sp.]MCK5769356.1 DUF3293 domain-containing protein [Algiphilus sp.]